MTPVRQKGLGFDAILHQNQDLFALKNLFENIFFLLSAVLTAVEGEDTHSRSRFSQFQTIIKYKLI